MSQTSPKKSALAAIFLTLVLDLLGFGLVLPFLAQTARDRFHVSAFVAALIAASYSLMQFAFVPLWGALSDRVGRRPVLLASVAATCVSWVGLFFALTFGHSVLWLFLARAFAGVATANIAAASAYIADVTPPERRAKGMALIGIGFGVGFMFGPALGGQLAQFPVYGQAGGLPCLAAAALSLLNLGWVYFGLPESLPVERRRTNAPLRVGRGGALLQVLRRPGVGLCVLLNFAIIVSFTNLDQTFSMFHADRFGLSAQKTGMIFAWIGVWAALTQGAVRPLSGRLSAHGMIRTGLIFQALGFGLLALSPTLGLWALWLSSAIIAVGNGLTQPSVSAYISRRAAAHEQGEVLGASQAWSALGRVLGPALGGLLYAHVSTAAPYVSAAVGMGLAAAAAGGLARTPALGES